MNGGKQADNEIKKQKVRNNMAEKVKLVIEIPKYYLTHPQDYTCLAECVRRGALLPKKPCVSKEEVNKLVDELARAISDERCCMSRGRSTASIMQDIIDLPPVTPQQTEQEEAEEKQEEKKMDSVEDKTWSNFNSILSMYSYYSQVLDDITQEPIPPCFNSICDLKYLKFVLDGLEDAMAALTMLYKNILERSGTHGE